MSDYNLSRLQMLAVDDYQPMLQILKSVLFALGIKSVLEARGAEEALDTLQTADIDIVLADNLMNPVGGIEMVSRIRAGENGINPYTPVIMISGYSDLPHILEARDAGINEFLAKPISARMLYLRICSVIDSPRRYISSENFFGPDRRRRYLEIDEDDRRSGAYTYEKSLREKFREEDEA